MKRLRLDNNIEEEEELEALNPPDDRYFYAFILFGVFLFFIITYPYRDITIPSPILASMGFLTILGLVTVSYLRPQYYFASIAFCIYIPFSGEYSGDFGNMLLGMNYTNILVLPVILQWLMQRSYMRTRLVSYHTPDPFIVIFCLLSSIAVLRVGIEAGTGSFAGEFVRLKRWLFPFVLYFLFVNIQRNEKGVKYLIVTIGVALTAIAILTMKESFDIGPAGSWDKIRVKGVLGSPNGTGAFFVYYTLIFLGFFLCYWRHSPWAWLLIIPFLMCGRAMTLANSRGGMIAFTLAILATLLIRSRLLFLVGLTVVILGYKFPEYLPETISGRLFSTVRDVQRPTTPFAMDAQEEADLAERLDASAQGRLRIWKAGLRMVKDRPWFGHGYGEFPRKVGWYGPNRTYDPMVAMRDPHNTYLGVAAEMGVIALFFFVVTLLLIFHSCLIVYWHAPDLFMRSIGLAGVGMVLGVMSANFFGSRLDTTELTAYFWIISAIIVQYEKDLKEKLRAEMPPNVLVADPWKRMEEEELL